MGFGSIPITGKDAHGNSINLMTNADGSTVSSGNTSSLRAKSTNWKKTVVSDLFQTAGGTVAYGHGVDGGNVKHSLVWVKKGTNWVIGDAYLTGIRSSGLTYSNNKWQIAGTGNVWETDYSLSTQSPVGGFADNPPSYKPLSSSPIPVDNLSFNGTVLTAASLSVTGTWTANTSPSNTTIGLWDHNVGKATPIPTGHKQTNYKFPGYVSADPQLQITRAVPGGSPIGDGKPVLWDTGHADEVGFFGITGKPSFNINWT